LRARVATMILAYCALFPDKTKRFLRRPGGLFCLHVWNGYLSRRLAYQRTWRSHPVGGDIWLDLIAGALIIGNMGSKQIHAFLIIADLCGPQILDLLGMLSGFECPPPVDPQLAICKRNR
jgi:hypothetical protein